MMPIPLTVAVCIGIIAILVTILIWYWYETPGPQKAIVFPGRARQENPELRVLVGRSQFVPPPRRPRGVLDLGLHHMEIIVRCDTDQALKMSVPTQVGYRVGNEVPQIRRAALLFLGRAKELEDTVAATVDGNVRAVIGTMSFEHLLRERSKVEDEVAARTVHVFEDLGLVLVHLTLGQPEETSGYGKRLHEMALQRMQKEEATTNREVKEHIEREETLLASPPSRSNASAPRSKKRSPNVDPGTNLCWISSPSAISRRLCRKR